MDKQLKSAGKFILKATALKVGRALLRPRNLKKLGMGAGAAAAAGVGYLTYKAFTKKK